MPLVALALLACSPPDTSGQGDPSDDLGDDTAADSGADSGADSAEDTGDDSGEETGDDTAQELAEWTVLVYLDADNDLEYYAFHDLNEMESGGSGGGVNVLVQVDRAEGHSDAWGDWTDTRRYEVVGDDDTSRASSVLVEELGEADMGDPATLAEFLAWGAAYRPARNYAVFLWNHGDGWKAAPPPPSIASDDESGNWISIAEGELTAGLQGFVDANGPITLLGFDACYMGSWEVAHSLRHQARYMVASEAWVGGEGVFYGPMLQDMRAGVAAPDIARNMAAISVQEGGEFTFSAVDLAGMDTLAAAVDALAGWGLQSPEHSEALLGLRDQARGADVTWGLWYLDLRDLAVQAEAAGAAGGAEVLDAMDASVLATHGNRPFEWAGGLSIFSDFSSFAMVNAYGNGAGATWSQATRWDEWLRERYAAEQASSAR